MARKTTANMSLRLQPETMRRLDERAADTGASKNTIVETAVILFLAALLPNDQENTTS